MLPLLLLAALSADVAPERQRAPKPSAVALVFSAGYAGDHLPKDDARFEKLLIAIKAGGFNTVHTTYTKARVALCKKHGVKLGFMSFFVKAVVAALKKYPIINASVDGKDIV